MTAQSSAERARAANEFAQNLQKRGKAAQEMTRAQMQEKATEMARKMYSSKLESKNPIGAKSDAEAVEAGQEAKKYLEELEK